MNKLAVQAFVFFVGRLETEVCLSPLRIFTGECTFILSREIETRFALVFCLFSELPSDLTECWARSCSLNLPSGPR
jgi:hypothetical protein